MNAITLRSGKELVSKEKRSMPTDEKTAQIEEPTEVQAEEAEAAENIPPMVRVYTPKLPYPVKQRKSRRDLEAAKCKEMVSELNVKLSFEDAVEMMPALKRYVKSLVTNKASPKENVMSISKRCSTLLQNRAPEKMEDPGSFVLSCEIEGAVFEKSLCDLGSSVNLMPYTVAQRLGLTNFRSTKIQLVFADRSVRHPVGVILDIDVVIGNHRIPADFVVLELDQEPKDPLILGRPFLATAGAIIDVKKGKIDLHLGDIIMKFEVNKMLKRPTLDGHTFSIDHASEDDDEDDEVTKELLRDDPLEIALTLAESEHGYLNEHTAEFVKMLDSGFQTKHEVASMSLEEEESPTQKATTDHLNPWSELRAPKIELKTLPAGLRYAFLGPKSTYPVIINADLNNAETALLLCELRKYRKAIGYSLDDIPGISPDLCMHRIYLEDKSRNSIEHQRRLKSNLKDVVKKEIMKLLEAGIIYAISDSNWVSPVHVVPKKGGITVVKNEKDELIPTRTVTGHRMCIDYRKLNAATRKDHFPLPFIDQMLERLANHPYYCFLDGYSGFFQIPIHPDDQEKTTFTCPYGTFAYRRMPFGLYNAPAMFQRCKMSIFTDMIEDIMEVFMDDFSVYGSSFSACLPICAGYLGGAKRKIWC